MIYVINLVDGEKRKIREKSREFLTCYEYIVIMHGKYYTRGEGYVTHCMQYERLERVNSDFSSGKQKDTRVYHRCCV